MVSSVVNLQLYAKGQQSESDRDKNYLFFIMLEMSLSNTSNSYQYLWWQVSSVKGLTGGGKWKEISWTG